MINVDMMCGSTLEPILLAFDPSQYTQCPARTHTHTDRADICAPAMVTWPRHAWQNAKPPHRNRVLLLVRSGKHNGDLVF
jgi:hypothetical protein